MWSSDCFYLTVTSRHNFSLTNKYNFKENRNKWKLLLLVFSRLVVLKEADSVSQPAERVRTLWKRDDGASDPDPIHVPEPASLSRSTVRTRSWSHLTLMLKAQFTQITSIDDLAARVYIQFIYKQNLWFEKVWLMIDLTINPWTIVADSFSVSWLVPPLKQTQTLRTTINMS